MLPKKYRLNDFWEIERVKKGGRLFQSSSFGVLVFYGNEKQNSRIAFVVSLKIAKRSVERNRAKRLLSEAVRGFLPLIKPGYDLVFLIKKNLIGKNRQEVEKEVERIFKIGKLI